MLTNEQCDEFRDCRCRCDMVALSTKPVAHRKPQSMPTSERSEKCGAGGGGLMKL